MHMFGVVVWLGGLMFQGAVAMPVVRSEHEFVAVVMRKMSRRFVGYVWMSVWTILITGLLMMLLHPGFEWFKFNDRWSILLAWKEVIFVIMIFYAFGYARMLKYLDSPSSNGGYSEQAQLYKHRVDQFRTINIALGLVSLLLSAAMIAYV